jgi:GPH family glycoside/pentoside/hexuronide:cation symporter
VSVFRNRAFRYAVGIFLTSWVTVNLVAALFQYYLTYPMQMGDQVEIVLGLLQASALIFTAAAVWLATRRGKQQTYIVGAVWLIVIVLSLTFLPPNAQMVVFALAVLAGFGVAIVQVTPWSMVPDVMEVDELATGQRREATHYGILTFAQKGGTALALALMQAVLALTGYVAGAQQTPGVLLAIRLMMGPVPALLLAVSAVLALRYPLTRERYAEVRAQLAIRRSAAADPE